MLIIHLKYSGSGAVVTSFTVTFVVHKRGASILFSST